MTAKIAIIGLGQIGASIGLALKTVKGGPQVVGHDKDAQSARRAEAMGAVDAAVGLKDAVRDAPVVFLCLPLSKMAATLRQIGPWLTDGAVLLDTAPVKRHVSQWVAESVPPGRYHVGLAPAVASGALASQEGGVKAASADLFRRTVMMISVPPGTPVEVEQLGMNVAKLLGAKGMLADPTESDGIMMTAHVLPQLAASALIEAAVAGPGWTEARKLAGRPFAGVSGGMAYYDDPVSLQEAVLSNPVASVHALDVMIAALKGLRDDISRGDEENVIERLAHTFKAREEWLDERGSASWLTEGGEKVEFPDLGEQVMQMLFGDRLVARTRIKGAAEPKKPKTR